MSRPLFLYEIAHIIVSDKVGMVNLLKSIGLEVSQESDDESIFKVVIENKKNEEVRAGIFKIYDRNPLNQHCVSCFETIRELHDAGIVMSNELKSKSV